MVRYFSASLAAIKDEADGSTSLAHGAGRSNGETPEEVKDYFMTDALSRWPMKDGWRMHSVVLNEFAVDIDASTKGNTTTIGITLRQVEPSTSKDSDVMVSDVLTIDGDM